MVVQPVDSERKWRACLCW